MKPLFQNIKHSNSLNRIVKDLGIKSADFEKNLSILISLCYQDPSGAMAPRSPTKDDFTRLFTYAYDGKEIDF